jgi:hypothetical protein
MAAWEKTDRVEEERGGQKGHCQQILRWRLPHPSLFVKSKIKPVG